MKSTARAGAGGVIVVAAILALMFLRGGGGTPGSGSGSTSSENQSRLATTETDPTVTDVVDADPQVQASSIVSLTADEKKALSGSVLAILVDERSYLMEVPNATEPVYRPVELDRLIALAKLAGGDSNGIRVRILQRETARVSAAENLKKRLADIGIGSDAVYSQAEFIP